MPINTEIIVGFLAVVAGGIGYLRIRLEKAKTNRAEHEMSFTRAALDFGQFIHDWGSTHDEIVDLLNKTSVDRFMVLRAWNGISTPKWTTAVLQIRSGGQEPISYVHFELDNDYVGRLNDIRFSQTAYYDTASMAESAIKKVYEAEGVTGSLWAMIERRSGTRGAEAVTYCSFATHEEGGLTESDQTRCRIVAGRLKGISEAFYGGLIPLKRAEK